MMKYNFNANTLRDLRSYVFPRLLLSSKKKKIPSYATDPNLSRLRLLLG